jgi:hypothetical protein
MSEHLDLLGLDAVRAGDADSDQAAHALACAECRAEVDKLRRLSAALAPVKVTVPAALKARVLPRRRPWLGFAAAAGLLLAVAATLIIPRARRPDMVDAYRLALQIREGKGRDVNGDGAVDQRDVDELASRAVSLGGGSAR